MEAFSSNPYLLRLFAAYATRYMRRHCHAFRISRRHHYSQGSFEGPVLIYSNHPSWWDPLTGLVVWRRFFAEKIPFAPIDTEALQRFPFFKYLGFFGIRKGGCGAARSMIETGMAILQKQGNLLWITPQGRFADVRERPLRFRAVLGHLVSRLSHVQILPVAIEYPLWEDRLPEILLQFGSPFKPRSGESQFSDSRECTHTLETALERTLDELAIDSQSRNPERFETLWEKPSGIGGIYGYWSKWKAMLGRVREQKATP